MGNRVEECMSERAVMTELGVAMPLARELVEAMDGDAHIYAVLEGTHIRYWVDMLGVWAKATENKYNTYCHFLAKAMDRESHLYTYTNANAEGALEQYCRYQAVIDVLKASIYYPYKKEGKVA